MSNILIIEATSAVAKNVIRLYAEQNASLYLIGRNKEQLEYIVQDAKVRGATHAHYAILDACDMHIHQHALQKAQDVLGSFDAVLIAHGTLPDQVACEKQWKLTQEALIVNGMSVLSLMTCVGHHAGDPK